MIHPKQFYEALSLQGYTFFTGIPDSLLKNFCAFVTDNLPAKDHIIAANEGGSIGIGIGYHLATGKVPVVYMQNSGLGNAVNPLLSLADEKVYSIPVLLLIGWRGQPGVKDEPQHVTQGQVMEGMLNSMKIPYSNIGHDIEEANLALNNATEHFRNHNSPYALLVEKGAFENSVKKEASKPSLPMAREEAIRMVVENLPQDSVCIGTTGMASRELFEVREALSQSHERDFLTVGGMGHASQIALGVALNQPDRTVVCVDGDGAAIMHMGSLPIIADQNPCNLVHIVLNNSAHESVGGQPTVGNKIDLCTIASASGYRTVVKVNNADDFNLVLIQAFERKDICFIEVTISIGHRSDLGRPTSSPIQNKTDFMNFLKEPIN